jgi:hypothetical protein
VALGAFVATAAMPALPRINAGQGPPQGETPASPQHGVFFQALVGAFDSDSSGESLAPDSFHGFEESGLPVGIRVMRNMSQTDDFNSLLRGEGQDGRKKQKIPAGKVTGTVRTFEGRNLFSGKGPVTAGE